MSSPHNPYLVHARKALTPKQRLQLFIAEGGVCCICGGRIDGVKDSWDEHINPLWLDGTNDRKNRGVAHRKCARQKTDAEAGDRSKIRSVAEKHFGAHRAKTRPMPCGRHSPWKKTLDGRVVRR